MTRVGLAFVVSLLSCGEVYDAQGSLTVSGVLPVPLATPSSELTLTRLGPDRAADTVQIALVNDAAVLSNATTGPWTRTVDVVFTAGEASSTPFYVRSDHSGSLEVTLTSARLGQRATSIEVSPLMLSEDFEGGDFSIRDLKKWDDPVVQVPAKVALKVEAAGLHRGAAGLLVDDRDSNNGTNGPGEVARLTAVFRPFQGDQFVRAWVRVAPTSTVGEALPMSMWRTGAAAVYDLNVRLPGGTVEPAGYDSNGVYVRDEPSQPLADGQWHLWETAVLRLGTASAERSFWVDGQLVSKRTGMQSSGMQFTGDNFGLPWSNDLRFTGTIAFDDVRIGVTPHASRLALTAGPRGSACQQVSVILQDSMAEAPAPAPYDVELEVGSPVFSDSACANSMRQATVARGSSSTTFFVRSGRLSVAHADFLPSPELELSPGSGCACVPVPEVLMALVLFARARSRRSPREVFGAGQR